MKAWHDGLDHWIFETREVAGVRYGVLVDASGTPEASEELPVESFVGHMPYSDFKPFPGQPPAAVLTAFRGAKRAETRPPRTPGTTTPGAG